MAGSRILPMRPAALLLSALVLSALSGCDLNDCGPFPDTRETIAVSATAEAPRAASIVVALVQTDAFLIHSEAGVRPVVGETGIVRLSGSVVRPVPREPLVARLAVRSDTVFVSVDAASLVRPACSPPDYPPVLDVTLALPPGTSIRSVIVLPLNPPFRPVSTEGAAERPFLLA